MRADRLAAAAATVLVVTLLGATLLAVPAQAEDAVPVDGAVLRWGLNDESSNRAYAPHTYNFLSAGLVPDPGRGGTTIPRSRWKQRSGDVQIQKWDGSAWRPATWRGLRTDSDGTALGTPTAGTFSHHRFAITGGTGEVDVEAGTAHVAWDGDVTVLYYSGMSMFHISDPVLDVADGRGTLTATVSGYASSVDDPDRWEPVDPATVTLADLPDVDLPDVAQGTGAGFTATPAYLGVLVDGLAQATGDRWTGSFPQSFVDYMDELGTAPFWLSSGSATDAFKVALPLSVALDPDADQPEPTPSSAPTQEPVDNPVVPPPATVTVTATPEPAVAVPPSAAPPPTVQAAGALPAGAVPAAALPAATQLVAATPKTSAAAAETESDAAPVWWLGGGLLLAAALTLLIPVRKARR